MMNMDILTRRQAMGAVLGGAAAIGLMSLPGGAAAGAGKVYKSRLGGVAIDGMDTVAYFLEKRPVKGSKEFTHDWSGATWRFASAANRDKFAAEPEKYAPQYGGFCAWAVAQGYTASTEPETFAIVDGRLYLNYSMSVKAQWETDIPGHITKADANWPGIK